VYADESCINVIQIQIQKLYLIGTCVVRQVFSAQIFKKKAKQTSLFYYFI